MPAGYVSDCGPHILEFFTLQEIADYGYQCSLRIIPHYQKKSLLCQIKLNLNSVSVLLSTGY
jgi:hypothetical protein